MELTAALDRLRRTDFLLDVIRAADDLALTASRAGGRQAVGILRRAIDDKQNQLVAIAAVHALGRVFDDEADDALSELLSSDRAFLREHAAWAFGSRLPRLDAVSRLVACVVQAGFTGMLAQRTLQQWAVSAPDHVALALEGALVADLAVDARTRVVETLGLVSGRVAGRALRELASDTTEHDEVRIAAIAGLGDRRGDERGLSLVRQLASIDSDAGATGPRAIAEAARLALIDLGDAPAAIRLGDGITVAQLFLHADIDRGLTRAGAGDNGGVATLLVRLGDALANLNDIDRVLTMSRGDAGAAADSLLDLAARTGADHEFVPVPLLSEPSPQARSWHTRVAAERGIRRALTALGPVDVLHLRMADVGSMAASSVARELGIPVVFTLAPDPHGVIRALDVAGSLTPANFGDVDEHEHYWFRHRLVQRLAADADHTVLFPRPAVREELQELLGIDIAESPERYTVVPEGIDLATIDDALLEVEARNAADSLDRHDAIDELDALIAALPEHRRGLPIALSVGRLHRVKGMATIVEAWAADAALFDACNLVIVGGDLLAPSADEQSQLDAIDGVLRENPRAAEGLVLAGHRPNDVVSRWLAVTRLGSGDLIGASGIYVCGSLKEEFGIAILEALAAGLVVVTPDAGGPATYVDDGVTGILVDTGSATGVRRGMTGALQIAARDDAGRVDAARGIVRNRFTVQAMATALEGVYASVVEGRRLEGMSLTSTGTAS
ncbi:Glycosyltransferase involved in cell wall bisynthesis [Agreia bicolorata]|uniref:D-inositol 3-phosphate glycosyltransferase n=1 Tax=Agreia bicolorata TaxID=110935 RepID=A0A1T4Y5J9_9MICO|nr:glycosyltransferase [Agreia bicolorata]SKA96591.1 Glycosyltransferase involved in cell wall bisynthesis [Agreia bicolorata]